MCAHVSMYMWVYVCMHACVCARAHAFASAFPCNMTILLPSKRGNNRVEGREWSLSDRSHDSSESIRIRWQEV